MIQTNNIPTLPKSDNYYNTMVANKIFDRSDKSWNQHPDFFKMFANGEFKDKHPVTLEPLDTE